MTATAHENGDGGKYACCCGPCLTHVEKGALIIAIIGIVCNLLSLIGSFFTTTPWTALIYLLAIPVYVLIILAQRKANPSLYLPYLVIMAIILVTGFILVILSAIMGNIAAVLIFLVGVIMNGYFYSVIFRAYKYMKESEGGAVVANQTKA